MKRSLMALALMAFLTACPDLIAQPPVAFDAMTTVASDTIKVTADPCQISEPGVACAVTLVGTAGGSAIAFAAVPNMAPGASLAVSASFTCTAPGQPVNVSVTVTSRALNRSGQPSTPTQATGTASYTCADATPGAPGTFTVNVIIVVGGG